MKKFLLPTLLFGLIMSACSDKFDNSSDDANRYFIYSNTIPYYFYDSTGNLMIDFNKSATYPISYVEEMPDISLRSATSNNLFLSNYDGIGKDSDGKTYWYSYNKGCYDSTHFRYFVHTPYLLDTIDIEYKYDTLDTYDILIYVHKLTYNGVVIRAYEEDTTKLITSDRVNVFKYKDKTVVQPVYKEKETEEATTK
ncbi:MAG: hypothetical protein J5882_01820 [Bacteroidales bacterium]|nr:hypothetical protein [Bacteroidales bacterium]